VCADLDTLVIAVYCAACALFPAEAKPGRGRPELITDNELVCLMVAQMLLQAPSDRRFLCLAHWRLRHLFPHLPSQSRYNERCRRLVPKLLVLWKALAAETLGAGDQLRLLDTTPCPAASRSRRPAPASSHPGPASATARPTPAATGASNSSCSAPPTAPSATSTWSPRTHPNGKPRSHSSSERARRRDRHLRQRHRRRRLRSRRRPARSAPAAPQPQRRTHTTQPTDRLDPPTDRIDHRHPQRPTHPRTPRRPHPRRTTRPHHRPHPRPLRHHQPQPTTRTPQPLTHRIRPLIDQSSRRSTRCRAGLGARKSESAQAGRSTFSCSAIRRRRGAHARPSLAR
jgi:hypothetical protein